MQQPGRNGNRYRFGFNGMEKDDEVKGGGNSYTTLFRQYDPRLGRWMSVDPMMIKYPGWTPYNFAFNNPINKTDPEGDDPDKQKKLKKAAKKGADAADDVKEEWKVNAACNIAVQEAVSSYTDGKVKITGKANQMAKDFEDGEYSEFEQVTVDITTDAGKEKLQDYANNGVLVVGILSKERGSGHTVMLVPGEMESGDNWKDGGEMPVAMEGGSFGTYEKTALTTAMGQESTKKMNFYVYIPSLEKTTGKEVVKKTQSVRSKAVKWTPQYEGEGATKENSYWTRGAFGGLKLMRK